MQLCIAWSGSGGPASGERGASCHLICRLSGWHPLPLPYTEALLGTVGPVCVRQYWSQTIKHFSFEVLTRSCSA